jgi:hypothetical protein
VSVHAVDVDAEVELTTLVDIGCLVASQGTALL